MFKNHQLFLIVATDNQGGIAKNGKIPWDLPKERQFFQKTTTKRKNPQKQNLVIMGSKTWKSLPVAFRPLSGRKNVVLSQNKLKKFPGAQKAGSFLEAFKIADDQKIESIFVIGGEKIYQQALDLAELDAVLCQISYTQDCGQTIFSQLVYFLSFFGFEYLKI